MLLVVLVAACASQPKRDEVFLAELAMVLPGSYDNIAQARSSPGHAALRLVVAPVQAALLGKHVYFVQEMAADDAQRVMSQRLFILQPVEGAERALLLQADFAEPMRWRDGHLRRDLFKSLLPEDLRPRVGCDVVFTRADGGFTGAGRDTCRISAPGTGETLRDAVTKLQALHRRAAQIGVKSSARGANPELVSAYRAGRMIKLALCVASGALQREESRGAHFRADFPLRNDRDWLCRTLATWGDPAQPAPTLRYEALDVPRMELPPDWRGYGAKERIEHPATAQRRSEVDALRQAAPEKDRHAQQDELMPFRHLLPPYLRGPNARYHETESGDES